MGLLSVVTWPATWPVGAIRGVVHLAAVLQDHAERQLRDPALVRRQLEQLEEARLAGQISEEDEVRLQQEILGRLIHRPSDPFAGD